MKVMLSGKPVKEIPLIALEDVETAGFFKRLWHAMRMLLQ
jgi:D-alanyl-D-alanine carboxypeptidase